MHDIEERVRKIIAEQFCVDPAEIDLSADFTATHYQADSLDLVEITMEIEDEFGVEIDDDAMFALRTGQQLIECVTANAKA